MDDLAAKYLHRKTVKFEEIAGKGAKQLTFNQIPLEAGRPLCCRRCGYYPATA
jgi:DNA polymerase-1